MLKSRNPNRQRELPLVLDLIFDQPHAITASKLESILRVVGTEMNLALVLPDVEAMEDDEDEHISSDRTRYYAMVGDQAVVPVMGTLVQRRGSVTPSSGMQGYNGIIRMVDDALEDPKVKSIMLDVNSSGGTSAGMENAARFIREANAVKPITAFINERGFSAAYGLASAAGKVLVTPGGMGGSIGVVMSHVDRSKALESKGEQVTFIYAGKHKVEGNEMAPLSPEVKQTMQGIVDHSYARFVNMVAEHRGMEPEAVRATEAGMFNAEQLVSLGLADGIATESQLFGYTRTAKQNGAQEMELKQLASQLGVSAEGTDEEIAARVNAKIAELKQQADDTGTLLQALGSENIAEARIRIANMVDKSQLEAAEQAALAAKMEADRLELISGGFMTDAEWAEWGKAEYAKSSTSLMATLKRCGPRFGTADTLAKGLGLKLDTKTHTNNDGAEDSANTIARSDYNDLVAAKGQAQADAVVRDSGMKIVED